MANPASVQTVLTTPHPLQAFADANWTLPAVSITGPVLGYRLIPSYDALSLTTPMYAQIDGFGPSIVYNPALCSGMGRNAVIFVFLHEVGHHVNGHCTVPVTSQDQSQAREATADTHACNQLIQHYPRIAPTVFQAAHDYFAANPLGGGGSHPLNGARATNMVTIWTTVYYSVRCHILLRNDMAVTQTEVAGALRVLGYGDQAAQQIIKGTEAQGMCSLAGPLGVGYNYSQALPLIAQIIRTSPAMDSVLGISML